jgi:hypothetical protein
MTKAPSFVPPEQLKEVHVASIVPPAATPKA